MLEVLVPTRQVQLREEGEALRECLEACDFESVEHQNSRPQMAVRGFLFLGHECNIFQSFNCESGL